MSLLHDTLRATASALLTRYNDEMLALDSQVAVGVGYAALTRDGVPVYEADCFAIEEAWSVRDAERLAAAEPDRDWRIHLVVALRDERHYRRRGDGRWLLYKRGYGLS